MENETIVISLGGSLIVPNEVDSGFVKNFKDLILTEIIKGKKFVIITGGGKLCRNYNSAAEKIKDVTSIELDWLGIYATRFNAEFIRMIFGEEAEEKIITDPTLSFEFNRSIILGGGWKPGNSTDLVAVTIAKQIDAKKIINLSNTDHVYDSDPKVNPNAKKLEKISWAEYRVLIPKEWNPGLNSPFDPIASELAEQEGISVVTMNGKPIDNLAKYLDGKEFLGTVIS